MNHELWQAKSLRINASNRTGTVIQGENDIPVSSVHHSTAQLDSDYENQIDPWVHVNRVVAKSGTSFLWGMRVLPAERRRAMYAIYTFCREVDDVVDEPGKLADKRHALAAWRNEIDLLYAGRPSRPTTRALLRPVERFNLPKEEFLALIDGMEIDAAPAVWMQTMDDLLDYCRKVAGTVAMLSINAFGAPEHPAPRIAACIGIALQLTNILRDLKTDADLNRVYVPVELLSNQNIPTHTPHAAITHPLAARVCAELAEMAHQNYAETDRLIAQVGRQKMRPFIIMMAVYRETLARLEARGWHQVNDPIRLSQARKIWLALRHGFF